MTSTKSRYSIWGPQTDSYGTRRWGINDTQIYGNGACNISGQGYDTRSAAHAELLQLRAEERASPDTTETLTFFDDAAGIPRTGIIENRGVVAEQLWLLVDVEGIQWAIPQGWPNNAVPICEASEPEGYAAIAEALGA